MSTNEISTWFSSSPLDHEAALDALRSMVLSTGDGTVEEIKWGRPCYSTKRGLFCYLQKAKSHVAIGFPHGSALEDPDGLLEGTGKDMRHVKLNSADDVRGKHAAITALLQQAIEL